MTCQGHHIKLGMDHENDNWESHRVYLHIFAEHAHME